ncbi:MAG: hypothetical protein FJW20_08810 [Acidimicrobiia bacterium]|nr:hypothetical protein [Acidimicrobiia bacterium]
MRLLPIFLFVGLSLTAQAPKDTPYVPTAEERAEIQSKLAELDRQISTLRDTKHGTLLADVEVYSKAASWIMRFPEEFFNKNYLGHTLFVLDRGLQRARQLAAGNPEWTHKSGHIVHAYRSRVDGSLQPYAVVVPKDLPRGKPARLDVVLHGRGATLNEISFIQAHENPKNAPAYNDRIELHVFGRTNNAYRWSGETDVFEALASVESRYKIDPARTVLRGFSMGGAGTWHMGLHHPSRWAAMEAGAGFSETRNYASLTDLPPYQAETLTIYDAVEYSANAFNLPIVGYGGELDRQLQASTNIKERLVKEGLKDLRAMFLIGPKTEHKWHPDSKAESDAFLDAHLHGPPSPRKQLRFVTFTTRYNQCDWLTIDALDNHYQRADVTAGKGPGGVWLQTHNVAYLSLSEPAQVSIDGQQIPGAVQHMEKRKGKWVSSSPLTGLRKRHGLQGPIDDAFMDSFLCVRPSNGPDPRLERFSQEFAKWLRGDIRIAADTEVTNDHIRDHHLILFGTPENNALIRKVAGKLPIQWSKSHIRVGLRNFDARTHTLAMIYPNPLNPERYVVLNSGHTFGEKEFRGTNALLFPRLGDWAVLDANGNTVAAGLFDDFWQLH